MFTTLLSAALFSALAFRGVKADDFSVATPQFTQCEPVHVTWSGGAAPYNFLIVPNDDPCEKVLVDLGDHNGQSITWNVTLAAGTQILLSLADNTGDEAWSNTITVGASNDTSCLPGAASSSVSASASASTVSASGSTPTTTLTIAATAKTAAASSASAASSSSSAAVAVGAANAGLNPDTSGASSAIQKLSGSAVALAAVAAIFASL